MGSTARFTKAQRLLTRADFDRVQTGPAGRKAQAPHFLVLAAPLAIEPGPARLGVIASRRVGSAVHRNRAKRLVRHFFRTHATELGSFDVVIVIKTGAQSLTQAQTDAELIPALVRLGVRKAGL